MAKAIDQQLKNAIAESGFNINQLAKETGISQPVLYRFFTGSRDLYLETAAKLAAYFGMELTAAKRVAPAATSPKSAKSTKLPAAKKRTSRTE